MLFRHEGSDLGGQRVTGVLVAVIVPAEDRGEPARLHHLGHEDRLPIANCRRPPRRDGRAAVALLDGFIEWMNARVVPRLVAIDEHARPPRLVTHTQGGAPSLHDHWSPAVEGH